jgi:Zn-dependent metalloprotease
MKKKITTTNILAAILLVCIINPLHAQDSDTVLIEKDKHGNIVFARFKPDKGARKKSITDEVFLKEILNADDNVEFRLERMKTEETDFKHSTYRQFYKGLKVEHAAYILHGNSDGIEVMNGNFADVKFQSVRPSVTESNALQAALGFVGATTYNWNHESMEKFIKKNKGSADATYFPKGELLISKDMRDDKGDWRLAWKFVISSIEPVTSQLIYVDATTGEIIGNESLICHVNTPGTAQTRYSNNRAITGDSFAGGFRLRENRNGVDIETLNLRRSMTLSDAVDFTDNDNNWTAIEHNNAGEDQVALDAHWGAETVLDYWRTVHGRNSLDGNGLRIRSYVHFGNNVDNAYWDGNEKVMKYGDGLIFNPLTALDVCAHEFGHGVNQHEANLAYQKESGALNESLSDIWGAVIENWAAPEKDHWLMGEEINGPLRSLSNPNQFGQPDTYGGTFWFAQNCSPSSGNDYCGVHTNSGVMNFWFFLLSDGGTGTNDLGNPYSTLGIGLPSAAKIVYRAETFYLTSSSDFTAARMAMIQAASDLYGANSEAAYRVAYCWWAVGVGRLPVRYNNDLQGPTQLTPGYVASYFVNPPVGATAYVWTIPSGCKGNYCWTLQQGQGTNHIVVQAGKTGSNQEISLKIYNGSQMISNKYILVNVQSGSGGGGGGGTDPCGGGGGTDPNALTFINSIIYPPQPCDPGQGLRVSDVSFERVVIYNTNGLRVKDAIQVNSMSVHDLAPGLYIVRAQLKNGEVHVKKFSK